LNAARKLNYKKYYLKRWVFEVFLKILWIFFKVKERKEMFSNLEYLTIDGIINY